MNLPLFYDSWRCDAWRYEQQDATDAEFESVKERARAFMSGLEENPDITEEEYAEISAYYDSCATLRDYREFLGEV